MRLRDELNEQEYLEKKADLMKQKEQFKELLNDTDNRQNQSLQKAEQVFTFAKKASFDFENGTLQKKREILHTLGSNLTLKDGKLNIDAYKPFVILRDGLAEINNNSDTLEPKNHPIQKGRTKSFDTVRPLWLGRWGSNPRPSR